MVVGEEYLKALKLSSTVEHSACSIKTKTHGHPESGAIFSLQEIEAKAS